MSPPYFAHKKRKSRSRGASAKRASRNRSARDFAKDPRSVSVDVNSVASSTSKEALMNLNCNSSKASCSGASDTKTATGSSVAAKESSIQSLADTVASAAIVTAENALKGSSKAKALNKSETFLRGKETQKKESDAKRPMQDSISQTTESKTLSQTSKMAQREEKLDSLCKLLERLETSYCNQNGPSKSSAKVNASNIIEKDSPKNSLPGKLSCVESKENEVLPKKDKNDLLHKEKNDSPQKKKPLTQKEKQSPLKKEKSSPQNEKNASTQKEKQISPKKENKSSPQNQKQATPQKEKQASQQKQKQGLPQQENKVLPQQKPHTLPQKEIQTLPQQEKQALPQQEKQALPQQEKQVLSHEENQTLSQEEKQALRKARKEGKKTTKQPPNKQDLDATTNNEIDQAKHTNLQQINSTEAQISNTNVEKSKADLKRERREKQEAQRAAKEAAKKQIVPQKQEKEEKIVESVKLKNVKKSKKEATSDRHLPLLEHLSALRTNKHNQLVNCASIHPAVRAAGLCMKEMTIDGCIARVVATLSAIYNLIEDYNTPPSCDLSRDLSSRLQPNIDFINSCRQVSEPMNNAIRFVKREINKVGSSVPERQAKDEICEAIDTYVNQNIVLASETIIENALQFIENEDVLLTYGFSNVIYETIKAAVNGREKFSVIVVDNPAVPSGVNLLQRLVDLGINVYYRILPDLPHIINKVTKVLVEAEAVVLNGAVIGPCGMAGLILLASNHSVPVIVLSHTFKFCNIDLTDSLVFNELGDSSSIVNCASTTYNNLLAEWKETPSLNVVNLMYDVTPASLINVLVTERNNFPTSVVPVIIKRNYADILGHD